MTSMTTEQQAAFDGVIAVPIEHIHANAYNPNSVAPPEMDLLYQSIKEDGYTMPVVCYKTGNFEYEIVDGYHRYRTMLEHEDIYERENGCLPVRVIVFEDREFSRSWVPERGDE